MLSKSLSLPDSPALNHSHLQPCNQTSKMVPFDPCEPKITLHHENPNRGRFEKKKPLALPIDLQFLTLQSYSIHLLQENGQISGHHQQVPGGEKTDKQILHKK